MTVALVDAFTATPGQGNRAGVVVDGDGLDDATMQRVATAVNASETAFVLSDRDCDFRIRWFTPSKEIDFCGHGTMATLHRLVELGRIPVPGADRFDCRVGPIAYSVERGDDGQPRMWADATLPSFTDPPVAVDQICEWLDVAPTVLDPAVPVRMAFGNCFVPLASYRDVAGVTPDFGAIEAALADGIHGLCVFARDPFDRDHHAFSRYFTPAYGIREDPVTGSTNAPLTALCAQAGTLALAPGGTVRVRNEQGREMGQAGHVDVELTADDAGAVSRIRFGTQAVTVLVGTLA